MQAKEHSIESSLQENGDNLLQDHQNVSDNELEEVTISLSSATLSPILVNSVSPAAELFVLVAIFDLLI